MTTLIAALQNSVLVIESSKNGWKTRENLKGTQPRSIAFDQRISNIAYCSTFGEGLWKTENGGQTWNSIGKNEISNSNLISVAVGNNKGHNKLSKVYVGTEPSALYASIDGGQSWEIMSELNKLESSKSWSFPPKTLDPSCSLD